MSKPLLSILIPTVVGRERQWNELHEIIFAQVKVTTGFMCSDDRRFTGGGAGEVELLTCKDNKEITIGEKRELLYHRANGLYSFQIDDDDSIAPDAIKLILEAITQLPDCITFQEHINKHRR
jgi:hypothetical protein